MSKIKKRRIALLPNGEKMFFSCERWVLLAERIFTTDDIYKDFKERLKKRTSSRKIFILLDMAKEMNIPIPPPSNS
jgi:hypothetical protein